ncbi:MAG: cryptochrome/photolyase family protein [Bacteroidales bacterium]
MSTVNIIFPDQLLLKSPLPISKNKTYLVEEHLFFGQFKFHKQKIAFHRAGMKFYENFLEKKAKSIEYVDATLKESDIRKLIQHFKEDGVNEIHYIDPVDYWLERRIEETCREKNIKTVKYDNPKFLNTTKEIEEYFRDRKKFFQTDFYVDQRKRRGLLLEGKGKPMGGKWSFDSENRKKYPAGKKAPEVQLTDNNPFWKEAVEYTEKNFSENYGELTKKPIYPTSFEDSRAWLKQFLEKRFKEFGPYEDAIVEKNNFLNHSLLSPLMNSGLLTPEEVLNEAMDYAAENDIPLNSLEGFVRQIVGWREFIRAMYILKGKEERTRNYWEFDRKIPASFYTAQTGIEPLDAVIKKVLKTGYNHHIERLMVLGNFMMLCEFDPDEVYQWFMEMFIDAYDWVMVPNVYGMSQFADGGIFATKPYISGSNYLMKMSDFKKGEWQQVWDGLFWRFMDKHREFFNKNPRMGMLVRTFDKMSAEKREAHLTHAENFLENL